MCGTVVNPEGTRYTHAIDATESIVPVATVQLLGDLLLVFDTNNEGVVEVVDIKVWRVAVDETKVLFGLNILALRGQPRWGLGE